VGSPSAIDAPGFVIVYIPSKLSKVDETKT
jgi:hypothetical protein